MKPIGSITHSTFPEVSCADKPQRSWNFIWYMDMLRYLLAKSHRANLLTIRNMKCVLLEECIFKFVYCSLTTSVLRNPFLYSLVQINQKTYIQLALKKIH